MQDRTAQGCCRVGKLRGPIAKAMVSLLPLILVTGIGIAPIHGHAQTSDVPPASMGTVHRAQAERDAETRARQRLENSIEDATYDGATASFGAITRGSAILNHSMGQGGTVLQMNAADKGAGWLGTITNGVNLGSAYAKDGIGGLKNEASQMGVEKVIGDSFESSLVKRWAVRRAISGGVAGAVASGGASIAFEGGLIVGDLLKQNVTINGKTIEDHVTDGYFYVAPDWVKERVSGVRQVDIDSSEFQSQQLEQIRRNRRLAFERVQRDNEAQHAQSLATRTSTMDSPGQSEPQSPGGSQNFLDVLNASMQVLNGQAQNMTRTSAASTSQPAPSLQLPQGRTSTCNIDPKTGCHHGHDERAHPGGCKCGR